QNYPLHPTQLVCVYFFLHNSVMNGFENMNSSSENCASMANNSTPTDASNKKVRKPYTITKSRESWTEEEHDKFLEALQLFDRDWKKIEDFVGSKTVIQVQSTWHNITMY
ncbi:hypothetical protein AABB24_037478, partial [Solanum stoloniferum]